MRILLFIRAIFKRSPKRVKIDPSRSEEIKEAITRADVRALIKDKAIKLEQAKGISRVRAKKTQSQKAKGRRKGGEKRREEEEGRRRKRKRE